MHPFALNDTQIEQVSGGLLRGMLPPDNPLTPIAPPKFKDEELTTLAIGEEGGMLPLPDLAI